ncbi:lysin motif [Caudoviricetes sp.]|nr:lysin motif [Caudoviricetes sp.]UOF81084.1 lysin motif [Caudoviricetes sp.]UOF82206.1 lysin motif [Caudoviricetes sp.]UOF82429.1 lysin motif [Caudoviricetes sp.]UOF82600.1 lysin motif [Caudoviricetes sp.]
MATYTVKPGDSWARIAGQAYGNQRWLVELAKANGGTGRMLHPGETIDLPDFDTSINPTISQGDWNAITSANNFGGSRPAQRGGGGAGGQYGSERKFRGQSAKAMRGIAGSGSGYKGPGYMRGVLGGYRGSPGTADTYPTPQIGSTPGTTGYPVPTIDPFGNIATNARQPGELNRTGGGKPPKVAPFSSVGSQTRLDETGPVARPTVTPGRTRTPSDAPLPAYTPGNALAAAFNQIVKNQQAYNIGLAKARADALYPPSARPSTTNRYQAMADRGIYPTGPMTGNYKPTPKVTERKTPGFSDQIVATDASGLNITQGQYAGAARYTGEAVQEFIETKDRRKLPNVISTRVAADLPFYNRAGVPVEDWLTGMGYYEFATGQWRILDPTSKYGGKGGGGGKYSSGGGGRRTGGGYPRYPGGGGGGGRRTGGGYPVYPGGGGGSSYYGGGGYANPIGLVNWRIGI